MSLKRKSTSSENSIDNGNNNDKDMKIKEKEEEEKEGKKKKEKSTFSQDFRRAVVELYLIKVVQNYQLLAIRPNSCHDLKIEKENQVVRSDWQKIAESIPKYRWSTSMQINLLPCLDAIGYSEQRLNRSCHSSLMLDDDHKDGLLATINKTINSEFTWSNIFEGNTLYQKENEFKIDWSDHRISEIFWGGGHNDGDDTKNLNLPLLLEESFNSPFDNFEDDPTLADYIYQVLHIHNFFYAASKNPSQVNDDSDGDYFHGNLILCSDKDLKDRTLSSLKEVEATLHLNAHMRIINKHAWSQLFYYTMESLCGWNSSWDYQTSMLSNQWYNFALDCQYQPTNLSSSTSSSSSSSSPTRQNNNNNNNNNKMQSHEALNSMNGEDQCYSKFGFASMHLLYCIHYNCTYIPLAITSTTDDYLTESILNDINNNSKIPKHVKMSDDSILNVGQNGIILNEQNNALNDEIRSIINTIKKNY
jgi:hypothetical protein